MIEQTPEVETEGLAPQSDDMGALYDKLTADGVDTEGEGGEEATAEPVEDKPAPEADVKDDESSEETADQEAEEEPEKVEAPHHLPASIRNVWASMPEDARKAVDGAQREYSQKMAELGRVSQVAKPIYDQIVGAIKDLPEIADMTPAQMAEETLSLARTRAALQRDPVGTLMQVAEAYGATDAMRAKLGGQAPDQSAQTVVELRREIQNLTRQIKEYPSSVDDRVNSAFAQRNAEQVIATFSQGKEHWDAVADDLPDFIPMAQRSLGGEASDQDILDRAYDMAVHANPDLRAKVKPPAQPQVQPDPARKEAQVRAKSVNVNSRSSGTSKPLTERQQMEQVWNRLVADQ